MKSRWIQRNSYFVITIRIIHYNSLLIESEMIIIRHVVVIATSNRSSYSKEACKADSDIVLNMEITSLTLFYSKLTSMSVFLPCEQRVSADFFRVPPTIPSEHFRVF